MRQDIIDSLSEIIKSIKLFFWLSKFQFETLQLLLEWFVFDQFLYKNQCKHVFLQRLNQESCKIIVSQHHIHLHIGLPKSAQLINERIMDQDNIYHPRNLESIRLPFQTRSSSFQKCTFAFQVIPTGWCYRRWHTDGSLTHFERNFQSFPLMRWSF